MLITRTIGAAATVATLFAAALAVTMPGADPAEADHGAAPTPVTPTAAAGHTRMGLPVPTTATVTAAELGPDSVVAVVTRGTLEDRDADGLGRSLEVITPDGVRHPVYSVDLEEGPPDVFPGDFLIADWRPETHTALLRVLTGGDRDRLVSYDVTTGAMHQVTAPQRGGFFALDPDGSGVLMTSYGSARRPGRSRSFGSS